MQFHHLPQHAKRLGPPAPGPVGHIDLEQNATKWLDKQQNVVRESVLRQLKHDLNPLVAKSLERLVNEKILPLIRNQVTAMKNEFDTSHQEQWAQIQAQLMMQRNISIGVGVIAILALIFVLI